MNIYVAILLTKIIENALATVRIIIIAEKRKIAGAILNGVISVIWIISTSMVIINITDNPYKIIYFCIGSVIGSYLGSVIEERMEKKK